MLNSLKNNVLSTEQLRGKPCVSNYTAFSIQKQSKQFLCFQLHSVLNSKAIQAILMFPTTQCFQFKSNPSNSCVSNYTVFLIQKQSKQFLCFQLHSIFNWKAIQAILVFPTTQRFKFKNNPSNSCVSNYAVFSIQKHQNFQWRQFAWEKPMITNAFFFFFF